MAAMRFKQSDSDTLWTAEGGRCRMEGFHYRVGSIWSLSWGGETVAAPLEYTDARPLTVEESAGHAGPLRPYLKRVRLQGDQTLAQKRVGSWTCLEIYQAFFEAYLNASAPPLPRTLFQVSFDLDVDQDACDRAGV
ncbi:MAG TPA: hypothetical protein VN157_13735 [Caulobacter sp.]|nr:hypothetical protein [Caulobacter sp.]